jgi:D-amino-acid dehydrogenase
LVVGNGLGAGGLTMGPLAGRLLADLVLERRPAIDLSPFGVPDRHIHGEAIPLR